MFSSFGKTTPISIDSQKSPTGFSSFGKLTPTYDKSPSEHSAFGNLSPIRKEGSVFSKDGDEFPPPPPPIYVENKNGQITKTEVSSDQKSETVESTNDEISNLQRMMMKQSISSQKTSVEKRSFTRTTQQTSSSHVVGTSN